MTPLLKFHIACALIFAIFGALQFVPWFRRRHLAWHRLSGRIVLVCGLSVAITGLWMNHFYPLKPYDGVVLYGLRWIVGLAMAIALILAVKTIQKKQVDRHRIWMMYAYALGMGAFTQILTHIPWLIWTELQGEMFRTIAMGAGWGINLMLVRAVK